MKCKIIETVFNDGHKEYLPVVKLHWWSRWKRVDSWGFLKSIDLAYAYDDLEKATTNIREFMKRRNANMVKSVRDIVVDENAKIMFNNKLWQQ